MWDDNLKNYFSQEIRGLNIELSNNNIDKFNIYSDMLKEWNEKINLTAITEDKEIILKHFIDSLTIAPYIENGNKKLIDVGTGAGFPGIPIKILMNDLEVTLLDSLDKRIKFLNEVISKLELNGISCIHGRAEDFGRDRLYREQFDYCTARAVAKLPVLLEYCLPFVKTGGIFIAMKGSDTREINESKRALDVLGGEIIDVKNTFLPEGNIERNIIIIRKVRQISTVYPRKAGRPTKDPII